MNHDEPGRAPALDAEAGGGTGAGDAELPQLLDLELSELRTVEHPVLDEVLAGLRERMSEPTEMLWGSTARSDRRVRLPARVRSGGSRRGCRCARFRTDTADQFQSFSLLNRTSRIAGRLPARQNRETPPRTGDGGRPGEPATSGVPEWRNRRRGARLRPSTATPRGPGVRRRGSPPPPSRSGSSS